MSGETAPLLPKVIANATGAGCAIPKIAKAVFFGHFGNDVAEVAASDAFFNLVGGSAKASPVLAGGLDSGGRDGNAGNVAQPCLGVLAAVFCGVDCEAVRGCYLGYFLHQHGGDGFGVARERKIIGVAGVNKGWPFVAEQTPLGG